MKWERCQLAVETGGAVAGVISFAFSVFPHEKGEARKSCGRLPLASDQKNKIPGFFGMTTLCQSGLGGKGRLWLDGLPHSKAPASEGGRYQG